MEQPISNKQNNKNNEISPVLSFQSDDLLEKLKMLHYEKQLISEYKVKPLPRLYFVKSINPGEQFYMFTLISWWLCRKMGIIFDQPQEFNDPNIIVLQILEVLQEIDNTIDFQKNQLIRGAGPVCIAVLDILATHVLKVSKLSYIKPFLTHEEDNIAECLGDKAEIILENLNGIASDESDNEVDATFFKSSNIQMINQLSITNNNSNNDAANIVAANDMDQQKWRNEIENVFPLLKVVVNSGKEWRSHFNQLTTLKFNIEEITEDTQIRLRRMHNELNFSLDKIDSREKRINNDLQNIIQHLKELSIDVSNTQHAHRQIQNESKQLLEDLNNIVSKNDAKKEEMELRSQVIANSSSVVHIKKAINRLQEQILNIDFELSMLLQAYDQEILHQTMFID